MTLTESPFDIAIIGMAGRFPGAENIEIFWQNLCCAKESIRFFEEKELHSAGIQEHIMHNPNYVKAAGFLEDYDAIDTTFFKIPPREAEITDPQHRILLECAYTALENAGYGVGKNIPYSVGVYMGMGKSMYLLSQIGMPRNEFDAPNPLESYNWMIHNDKDYLATNISYRLNLQGPSITVQTACSTSLSAVHIACQALCNNECDMALAGGATIRVPQIAGYFYHPQGITSPDGHCRAFDSQAQGMVPSSGGGVVVLKRLSDAVADKDYIYAIIKATAMNNDGNQKIGYTAPSLQGQANVIEQAISLANVPRHSIGYIECHGTGTILGDPIEIQALAQVFSTDKIQRELKNQTIPTHFCGIGSVKTNVGHLDAGAGICGLIKTALCLHHKTLVPSLHFAQANPALHIEQTPFYVVQKTKFWEEHTHPRRAGVSSLGVGGTNVHVILEEYTTHHNLHPIQTSNLIQTESSNISPAAISSFEACHTLSTIIHHSHDESCTDFHILTMSGATADAGLVIAQNLSTFIEKHILSQPAHTHTELNLSLHYTQNVGRKDSQWRGFTIASNPQDMQKILRLMTLPSFTLAKTSPQVGWIFPGQGIQNWNIDNHIFFKSQIFRTTVQECWKHTNIALNIWELLQNPGQVHFWDNSELVQPALFCIEYALAQMWQYWGISARGFLGHSLGEYVCATLAGVWDIPDVVHFLRIRGQCMATMPVGAMLWVKLPEWEAMSYIQDDLSMATIHGSTSCVISGSVEQITCLQTKLTNENIVCQRLPTNKAFHSTYIDTILPTLQKAISLIKLHPPQKPFISCLTGTWVSSSMATTPEYWLEATRQTVRFYDGVQTLLLDCSAILEIGPHMLSSYKDEISQDILAVSTMSQMPQHTLPHSLQTLGLLWQHGCSIHWSHVYEDTKQNTQIQKIPIPTYPWQRKRYWLSPQTSQMSPMSSMTPTRIHTPHITDIPSPTHNTQPTNPHSDHMQNKDSHSDHMQNTRSQNDNTNLTGQHKNTESTDSDNDHAQSISSHMHMHAPEISPVRLYVPTWQHMLLPCIQADLDANSDAIQHWDMTNSSTVEKALHNIQKLLSAALKVPLHAKQIWYVWLSHTWKILPEDSVLPYNGLIIACIRTMQQEFSHIKIYPIDITSDISTRPKIENFLHLFPVHTFDIAIRGQNICTRSWNQISAQISPNIDICFQQNTQEPSFVHVPRGLRKHGVYILLGGLGGIGLTIAEWLARSVQAKLILVSRHSVSAESSILDTIQKLGAEIIVQQGDVCNTKDVMSAISVAQTRWHTVHGILHMAGVSGGKIMAHSQPESFIENSKIIWASKVYGWNAIIEAIQQKLLPNTNKQNLDWFVLFSSINHLWPNIGQAAYAMGNAFLDMASQIQTHVPTICIHWDTWKDVGMAIQTHVPTYLHVQRENALHMGLSNAEALQALAKVLEIGWNSVIITRRDLNKMNDLCTQQNKHTTDKASNQQRTHITQTESSKHMVPTPYNTNSNTTSTTHETLEHTNNTIKLIQKRPSHLTTSYSPPQNDWEQKIAMIWQELFGFAVGREDNFFELGGDSLIALQMLHILQDRLGITYVLRDIFNSPTVASMAQKTIRIPPWSPS